MYPDVSIGLLLAFTAVALSFFLVGIKLGASRARADRAASASARTASELGSLRRRLQELQREADTHCQQSEGYLRLLMKLPEIVKNINSSLSRDDLITAIVRMTKDLIDTDVIEMYIYDRETRRLRLVAGYGTNRGGSVEARLGEGLVGIAAENQTVITREQAGIGGKRDGSHRLRMAAPIHFKRTLLGVIGVGSIKRRTGNERTFLAMITDLAGIALRNTESLTTAKKEAMTDPLTGLYNRRYFFDRAVEASHRASSYEHPFSVFIFDVDNFKHYNDTNGHAEGDVLLRELGAILRKNTRSTDIVARYGGEEFIVLLSNCGKEHALAIAEKIRKLIEGHPFRHREKQPLGCVSVSGGVATFTEDGASVDEVVKRADEALYRSKESGRNRVTRA